MIYLITNKLDGKRYVGKTTRTLDVRWYFHKKDMEYGSERYLNRAMRKHGTDNVTINTIGECSAELDNDRETFWISKLKPEYNMTAGGDGGWINDQTGNTWTVKDSSKMGKVWKGKRRSEEHIAKLSSGNNYQSMYHIHTPWGQFETYKDATHTAKLLRKQGICNVVTDRSTLRKYCEHDILLAEHGRRTFPAWRGQHTKQLGFYRELK